MRRISSHKIFWCLWGNEGWHFLNAKRVKTAGDVGGNESVHPFWWCHAGHKNIPWNGKRQIDIPEGKPYMLLTQMDGYFLAVICLWRWLMKRNYTLLFLQWGLSSFCCLLVNWASCLMALLDVAQVFRMPPLGKKLDQSSVFASIYLIVLQGVESRHCQHASMSALEQVSKATLSCSSAVMFHSVGFCSGPGFDLCSLPFWQESILIKTFL